MSSSAPHGVVGGGAGCQGDAQRERGAVRRTAGVPGQPHRAMTEYQAALSRLAAVGIRAHSQRDQRAHGAAPGGRAAHGPTAAAAVAARLSRAGL